MAKVEECIITNMVMIYDNQGNILVQDRTNPDWPGITFPGGHVEAKESFVKSAIREVKEETGLQVSNLKLCGFKQFSVKEYRYIVIYFKTNNYSGELKSSNEGKVFWIKREELDNYILANGFKEMITIFEDDNLNENFYFYDNDKWHLENL